MNNLDEIFDSCCTYIKMYDQYFLQNSPIDDKKVAVPMTK